MKVHNTLSKSTDSFEPANKEISVYTCGPTVYLDPHIGNWRMFIFYDTLVRTLRASGHKVNHVLNLTDVGHLVSDADDGEDKLQKSAEKQGKTAWDVAEHYIGVFKDGVGQLNISEPDHLPRATEFMDQQIALVQKLEEKGFTYQIDDGIYFDTSKFPDYGKMAELDLEGQEAGARVDENTQKRNPQDFAVWKFSPKDVKRDMEWESPWGTGFPGWHLECSAMAIELLGETIDIHAGGIDHIPVHHTNEIAQSEAATDKQFSRVWLHGEFMNVDGKKMSKSLGNVYTLEDIADKGFEALDFRLLVLQAHYRTHQNFTWEVMEAAANRRRALNNLASRRFQTIETAEAIEFEKYRNDFEAAMQNDLNTPQALSVIAELEKEVDSKSLNEASAAEFTELLSILDQYLGLNLSEVTDISDEQKRLIADRAEARANKDYARSDEIRDELKNQGIELDDRKDQTIWLRA